MFEVEVLDGSPSILESFCWLPGTLFLGIALPLDQVLELSSVQPAVFDAFNLPFRLVSSNHRCRSGESFSARDGVLVIGSQPDSVEDRMDLHRWREFELVGIWSYDFGDFVRTIALVIQLLG